MASSSISSQQKHKSQYFHCDIKQSKPLCTISMVFQSQSFNIPIYTNSRIQEIAHTISQNFCQKCQIYLREQIMQIQKFICYRLSQQIRRVIIKSDQNENKNLDNKNINVLDDQWSDSLLSILASHINFQKNKNKYRNQYQRPIQTIENEKIKQTLNLQVNSNKIPYFQDKYQSIKAIQQASFQQNKENLKKQNTQKRIMLRSNSKNTKSKKQICQTKTKRQQLQFNLYNRSKERLTKRKQKIVSRERQKLNTETKQCSFHPDISKSNEKYMKSGKGNSSSKFVKNTIRINQNAQNNVFEKLYSNASQLRAKKNFFRIKTEEAITMQQNKELTFAPKINQCSTQIIKMKKILFIPLQQNSLTNNCQFSQNWKQKTSTTCTQTQHLYLKKNNFKLNALTEMPLNNCNGVKSMTVFQKLFKNQIKSIKKGKKQNNYQKQKQNNFSFRPQLSSGTKKLLKQKNFPTLKQRVAIAQNFIQKSSNSKASLLSIQKYLHELDDKSNERASQNIIIVDDMFRAQSEQSVKYNHSLSSIIVNDQGNNKNQRDSCSQIDKKQMINQQKPAKKSQKLFNCRRNKIFAQIFQKLTNNERNKLKQYKQLTHQMIYSYNQFPGPLTTIFESIAQEMCRLNVGLDEQQFIWSLSNTYEHLSLSEKGLLLGWGVKEKQS